MSIAQEYQNMHAIRFKDTLVLIKELELPANSKVLEIGAAFGHLSLLLKQQCEFDVYAIDHYDSYKDMLEQNGIHFKKVELAEAKLPFDSNFFDLVMFTEVLEHLFILPHKLLFEIYRVLKPGGHSIITTPNALSLRKRILFLMGRSIIEGFSITRDGGVAQGHIREYTMTELEKLVKDCDFEIRMKQHLRANPKFKSNLSYRLYCKVEGIRNTFAETLAIVARKP